MFDIHVSLILMAMLLRSAIVGVNEGSQVDRDLPYCDVECRRRSSAYACSIPLVLVPEKVVITVRRSAQECSIPLDQMPLKVGDCCHGLVNVAGPLVMLSVARTVIHYASTANS